MSRISGAALMTSSIAIRKDGVRAGRKHLRLRRGESFPEPSVRRRKTVAAIRGKPREGDPPIAAVAVPTRRAARRSASPALLPGGRGRLLLLPKECRAKHPPNPAD